MPATDASVELLKSKLRQGGLYITKRQVGKTEAILELCAEFGAAHCIVIVPNYKTADRLRDIWRQKHGSDKPPDIWTDEQADKLIRGRAAAGQAKVFIDEFWLCDWGGPFYAAVATPPFHVEVLDI